MSKTFTPFFVYGPSKSGTTWLQKILDSHPDVRCHFQLQLFPFLNETGLVSVRSKVVMSHQKSPFKSMFKTEQEDRKYWVRLRYLQKLRPMLHQGIESLKATFPKEEDRAYLDQLHLETYRAIAEKLLVDQEGASIYGSKSTTDLEFMFRVFPNAKVISIVRDGRDVVTSKRFHMRRRGAYYLGDEKKGWLRTLNRFLPTRLIVRQLNKRIGWFGPKHYKEINQDQMELTPASVDKFANDWAMTTRFILGYKKKFPDQVLLVRYEGLRESPAIEMSKVFSFLDVPVDADIIRKVQEATDFKKLQKGQENGFFRKGTSGDWKNYFKKADKDLFKQCTGDLLVELGYEKDMNW